MRKSVVPNRVFICLISVALLLAGASNALGKRSTGPREQLRKADQCRNALYKSKKKIKYRHHWLKCIDRYRDLAARYPKSDQAIWALYKAARMYTKLYRYSGREADLGDAIELFRRVVEDHNTHRLADDAQYKIGEIYYAEKKDLTQAYVEFLKVDIKFPSGDMRPKARSKLDKLGAILSKRDTEGRVKEALSKATGLAKVENIRHWSTPTYTRVVVDLERPVKYESHLLKEDPNLKKPRRLYMDLRDTYVSADIESSIPIRDGLLQRARAGQYTSNSVRVVLDINSIGGYKIFHLHDPFRIVVDVRGTERKRSEGVKVSKSETRQVRKGIRKAKKPDRSISLARQLGLNVKRIVIDPGHGGKDPGCFHGGGVKEKHIVLKLAKTLAKKVEARLQCEAFLTRTKDIFLPLERRTAFANMKKADLFISLHINAHKQANVSGVETYFLNIATDERAVMVAARENATSEKNLSDLQAILNDLMLNTKISESSRLAHEVQKGMLGHVKKRYQKVKDLGVKQAPFYVLIGAEMPAVLVEMGFITNRRERRRLLSQKYLDSIADGIILGIEGYIKSIAKTYMGG
ncbi:MAG: N-acetylmuramoyl-L-alanine amidase [Desulfobacteraceae bacterium]|jgi:N-acetylmuramoyl-L-alanine amidase